MTLSEHPTDDELAAVTTDHKSLADIRRRAFEAGRQAARANATAYAAFELGLYSTHEYGIRVPGSLYVTPIPPTDPAVSRPESVLPIVVVTRDVYQGTWIPYDKNSRYTGPTA
jgi:hypothetical protein